MFDRYSINTSPRHVSVSVTEQRAPTDESVKMLREMEEAVQKRLLDAVRVNDSGFEAVIHVNKNPYNDTTDLLAVFSLNGRKQTATYRAERGCTTQEAAIGLRDAVAQQIANAIAPAFAAAKFRL